MKRILLCVTLTCVCAFLPLTAFAQWPTSATDNLLICDHTGEQAVPKIAATSDGGCYVAWYDLASGNYDVYLQRLNADGVPQWTTPCGMLISNHTQESWITDWDMTVDLDDHCIIAVNDIRAGGDWDIYGYRISPAGVFVWGPDGIALSDNANFEATPIVTVTSGGNIAFAWQDETADGMVTHVRKLTTAGVDVFTAGTITISSEFDVSIPKLAAADHDELLFQYLVAQGSTLTSPRHIYMQKYDSLGNELWFEDGAAIMTLNGIGAQMRPDLVCDGDGGAYSFWYDTRSNVHHVYVQHVNDAGVTQWTVNGVQTDLSANELQMAPVLTQMTDGVVCFYQATNTNQSLGGVQAQKLNTEGELQWGDDGVILLPLSNTPAFRLAAFVQIGNPTVAFSQYASGSVINTFVRAMQIDHFDGAPVWDPSPRDLCADTSAKGNLDVCINNFEQLIAVWPDSRIESGDIYVQNINPDGSLGPLGDLEPSIVVTSPEDSSSWDIEQIAVGFDVEYFEVAPAGGDGLVEVRVDGILRERRESEDNFQLALSEGMNEITLELVGYDFSPLEPRVVDTVHVSYAAPPPPSIVITYPLDGDWFHMDLSIDIDFQVENFEVADSTGDGWIHLYAEHTDPGEQTVVFVDTLLYSLERFLYIFDGSIGMHEISVTLVDYSGEPIEPIASDTVTIGYGDWAADDNPYGIPDRFALHPAYPNPFNPETTIRYDVQNPSHVLLTVHDLLGRTIATLANDTRDAGSHTVVWNGRNESGTSVPSGVYFVRMTAGSFTSAQKLMLIR